MTQFKRGELVEFGIKFGNGEFVSICGYYWMYQKKQKRTVLTFDTPASKGSFHYVYDDMVIEENRVKQ